MKDWKETDDYLNKIAGRGMKPGLTRMTRLLKFLGDPQKKFKTIHVTGTNAKGSVCSMIDSILNCAHYNTGLYTSPHLTDVRERIIIGGELISRPDFYRFVNQVYQQACDAEIEPDLTYFELLTAVAFCAFEKNKVELAVIEVGLGGRLDATNVIPCPEICVITNISLEHTGILGNTIPKIAKEKAGIIKRGTDCVTGAKGSAIKIIRQICLKQKARLHMVSESKETSTHSIISGLSLAMLAKICKLKGNFQKQNILLAMSAIQILRKNGWEITSNDICRGLEKIHLQGRFQHARLQEAVQPHFHPLGQIKHHSFPVLLDGAHNPAAIKELSASLSFSKYREKKCFLVFTALKDKDAQKMVRTLTQSLKISCVLIPDMNTERASSAADIRKLFSQTANKCPILTFNSVSKLWKFLRAGKKPPRRAEWILVTGSLYLIGETIKSGFTEIQQMDCARIGSTL